MKLRGRRFEDDIDEDLEEAEDEFESLSVEDLDGGDEDGDEVDDEPLTRQERRRQRGQERKGEREELQAKLAEQNEQLAEMRGRLDQLSRTPQQQPQPGPDVNAQVRQHMRGLQQRRKDAAVALVNLEQTGKATAEQLAEAEERYNEAEAEVIRANAIIAQHQNAPPPPPPHMVELQRKQAEWNDKHQDVMGNEHARAIANQELMKMRTGDNWVPTDADVKKATDVARAVLKLGAGDVDPTAQQRRATSGYASSTGGAKEQASDPIVMDADMRKMGLAWYDAVLAPELKKPATSDEEKLRAYRKYVLSS